MAAVREAATLAACFAGGAAAFVACTWLYERSELSSARNISTPGGETHHKPNECKQEDAQVGEEDMLQRMREALAAKRESVPVASLPSDATMPRRMRDALERKKREHQKASVMMAADTAEGRAIVSDTNASDATASDSTASGARQAAAKGCTRAFKPQHGAVLSLKRDTGKSTAECKAALVAADNVYDAARMLLMPEPVEAPCGVAKRASPIEGVFEPSERFEGGKPGWTFKAGVHGVGYYCEPSGGAFAPSTRAG